MAITPTYLDQLRARLSIAEVVGKRVDWDVRKSNPARGDYWACCPFHGEKSPSFHVEDRKGFFYCFGCHEKGDAIGFVMRSDNLAFHEAVEMLAREAGMPLPERDPEAGKREEKRKGLNEVMEEAQRFYRTQLSSAAAREAREYLQRRGLTTETLETFGIGYAPRGPNALGDHLRDKGYDPAIQLEAGLVGSRDDGSRYDRFRERITYPIRDQRGKTIAFGGRAMSDNAQAKYLNSPETPLFSKRNTLYNFGPARAAAGKGQQMIVAEGYMDVIALHQAGFHAAVAPLGTAMTEEQLNLLWRAVDEPLIALDGDAAGLRAAERTSQLALPALKPGKTLRFALLPQGKDPDDLIRSEGRSAIDGLIERAEPLSEFLWRSESEKQSLETPERRAAFDARIRVLLSGIGDMGVRNHYEAAFKERRASLFAPKKSGNATRFPQKPGGFDRNGPRGGIGQPPLAARNETRRSSLAMQGEINQRAMLESEILRRAFASPSALAVCCDSLAATDFANRELDLIRAALISAYFDLADQETGITVSSLLMETRRKMVRYDQALFERLTSYAEDSSDSDHLTSAIERYNAICAREIERREAEERFSQDGDEGSFQRMIAARASHQAELSRVVPAIAEEDTASVQHYIDQELWKKTKKRRHEGTDSRDALTRSETTRDDNGR